MNDVSVRRYSPFGEPGCIGLREMVEIWLLMRAEGLVEVYFHEGRVRSLEAWLENVTGPDSWFYAVMDGPAYVGFGVVNQFSDSGNTAFVHFCSFKYGRESGLFFEGCMRFHRMVEECGSIKTLLALLPGCYRAARAMVLRQGFVERVRLPGAMMLRRNGKTRQTDGYLFSMSYGEEVCL